MRVIRFLAEDSRTLLGEEHEDGTATVLADTAGALGPHQRHASLRYLLRGKRAVIADDDEGIRNTIGAILDKFECRCIFCADGREAIGAIESGEVDLVVSDIVMPGHDGYEVFAAARNRPQPLPVVLITGFGYDPGHQVVRASKDGLETVLFKPFTPQQLLDEISKAIRGTWQGAWNSLMATSESVEIEKRLAPIVPANILGIGRNYPGFGVDASSVLEVFMKPTTSIQGPSEPIRMPTFAGMDPQLDCEGELAVIIGTEARNVSEQDALTHVLGYTIANDVTARRFQTSSGPPLWMRGKGFDTFCPLGPRIVTADEIGDPGHLSISTSVNGVVVREGSTAEMLRPVGRIISELSRHVTLSPGTVILTGSPPRRRDEGLPRYLSAGDKIMIEIEGIGTLKNTVIPA